jgi:hypothetical protein
MRQSKFHTKIRNKKDQPMNTRKDNAIEVVCSLTAVGGFLTIGVATGFLTAYIFAAMFFVVALAYTAAEMRGK